MRILPSVLSARLPRAGLVIAACAGLLGGAVLAPVVPGFDARWLLLVLPFLVLRLRRHDVGVLVMLTVVCFAVGSLRGGAYLKQVQQYDDLKGQKVVLVGRAAEDGVYGERYQLVFRMDSIQLAKPYRSELPGSMTIKGFGAPSITRGDIVQAEGRLYRTRGNNFAGISFATITVLQPTDSSFEAFRRRIVAGMQSALPEPAASFGLGILIGQRSTLPEAHEEQLRKAGLTHIIAVSGYNLTIIVEMCRRLFSRLSKFQNTAVCVGLIGFFLFLTGLSPPIVRAAIISGIGLAAWYYGRTIKPMVLLLTGASITVLMNPSYMWGNVSWYLSFLAFYGVLVLAPLITRRLYGPREPKLVMQILLESACASVMTVPYILFIFGETSLVALLANLLVVPLIPFAMLASLVAGLAGMFVPAVAGWLAWPATQLLTYMLDIATILSGIPHAFVERIGFGLPGLVTAYASIGLVAWVLHSKYGR